jgi:hypothetical protein
LGDAGAAPTAKALLPAKIANTHSRMADNLIPKTTFMRMFFFSV